MVPEIMSRVTEWLEQAGRVSESVDGSNSTNGTSRGKRAIAPDSKGNSVKAGLMDWYLAYRRDPVEYQCIRKLACETLAGSTLAERSIKSSLGETMM
jgi:hypothetical protein